MNDLKSIIEDVNKSDIIADKVIEKIIEKIGQEEWHLLHDEYSNIITTTGEVAISLRNLMYTEKENEQLKENIKNARKKLFNILSEYEIGNYDNNTHQFYEDVYNVHNELMELAEMTDIDYSQIKYGTIITVTNFESVDDEETFDVFLVNDLCGNSGYPCLVVDLLSFEILNSFFNIEDFLNNVTVLKIKGSIYVN